MKLVSLDPRVTRMSLDENETMPQNTLKAQDHWETYEVFHQKKRGQHHAHVGIVHAPNDELALVFAKEQYARRGETVNLWIINSKNVVAMDYSDSDIFNTISEKTYREASGYKVSDKIKAYKESMK